ncbi:MULTISPECIES: phosphotransferase family protein [Exiguobacterium]|uniref:phosphotransferase family protein n=1 Tax=Exiguobacterium TaxID=33986 RepID=UPI00047C83AE|nr:MULTISPECIES: aminoglycoside phosphotransferase family protein [Exiguobacterium]MCT4779140.1 aminoglycoside phosphotransferase family protein [Exiguobacterium soli]
MKDVIERILKRVGLETETVAPLKGSTSSSVFRAGGSVFRIHTNTRWLKQEPDLVAHEVFALQATGALGPDVENYQLTWEDGLPPWIQMTYLPGTVRLEPLDAEYLRGLAKTLIAVHQLPIPKTHYRYAPYTTERTVPSWAVRKDVWQRAVSEQPAESQQIRFIHRDFHPVNVLYDSVEQYNVVDWINACVGPIEADVAHCRLNLALLESIEIADQFLAEYIKLSGFSYDRKWDLTAVFDIGPEHLDVYPGWKAYGKANISQANVRERMENIVLKVYENNESGY